MSETVTEAAERMYPGVTYDCALPQGWVDGMRDDLGFEVRGHFVWGYPAGNIFGLPLPLSTEAVNILMLSQLEVGKKAAR